MVDENRSEAIESDTIEPDAKWPLGDNALPNSLFPDEHLRTTMFDYLPIVYRCAASTIRKSLKIHLKRTVPGELRQTVDDQTTRDRLMARLFGNLPAARDRASEVKFVIEKDNNRRGRSGDGSVAEGETHLRDPR